MGNEHSDSTSCTCTRENIQVWGSGMHLGTCTRWNVGVWRWPGLTAMNGSRELPPQSKENLAHIPGLPQAAPLQTHTNTPPKFPTPSLGKQESIPQLSDFTLSRILHKNNHTECQILILLLHSAYSHWGDVTTSSWPYVDRPRVLTLPVRCDRRPCLASATPQVRDLFGRLWSL